MSKIRYPVFVDEDGNRFLFCGLYEDDITSVSASRCWELAIVLGLTQETDMMEIPVEDGSLVFPHVCIDITHPNLMSATPGYLVGGPKFDEVARESAGA
jgi:hypothetical protein